MPDRRLFPPRTMMPGQDEALTEAMAPLPAWEETTRDVRVLVRVFWLEDQSEPDDDVYCWAYRIRIENHSTTRIKLLERHWEIISATGATEYVNGPGVVGEQPVLEPASGFEYTSGASLKTSCGIMRGTYTVIADPAGEMFEVRIPAFSLDSPYHLSVIH
ncbi:MAG: Co2+/Mg2+ efflux protein ApaG [Acetobacter sp.]|jgi:ApaG protein|nr:Co2+/Mg2+ efflux protein ApaG [Acetobacter sp.]MCH4060872.1 Co2+/Mg2+ efflux protein ApaG [Acetobacter sp.]MCH4087812.1 Co2+/Mg2+ efflux protein ApaG [Acetobacter sp.]MCI1293572.1 Co2+/Mg2+ efflux protein ApaG [Acetobacter sp.]MCI1319856.1 Co2+/Mg2+ efflux protein ApaG [Acetobacter sp.]